MKTLVIRSIVTFTFLLALGVMFAGVNPPAAHAATMTTHKANIGIVNCDSTTLRLQTSNSGDWCFYGEGIVPVTIPNVVHVFAGLEEATVYGVGGYQATFPPGTHGVVDNRTITQIQIY